MKTINLKGNKYATVSARVKAFREDNPLGIIKTKYHMEGDNVIFKATVTKDQSKDSSAKATGHSFGPVKDDKQFEKMETVAVGRALAMLGYAGDGEIASTEEMEQFIEYRNDKIELAIDEINATNDLEELKVFWENLEGNLKAEVKVKEAKDKKKEELNESSKPEPKK